MSKKQQIVKRPPIWIGIAMILSMFIGIFTIIVGIDKIENYEHPYWFGLISGGIGLLIGILIAKKAKPYIAVNPRMKNNFGLVIMYISTGFIGISLLTGSIINKGLSEIETRDNFLVINKHRREAHFRTPEINSLFVNISGDSHRLICKPYYWDNTRIGQSIELCIYKSKLGFDFIEITNEKKASR
jgi:hypothetical protein